MPEKVAPGPVHDAHCIREAVCIDTKKIFDSCKEEDIAFLSKLPLELCHLYSFCLQTKRSPEI